MLHSALLINVKNNIITFQKNSVREIMTDTMTNKLNNRPTNRQTDIPGLTGVEEERGSKETFKSKSPGYNNSIQKIVVTETEFSVSTEYIFAA